VDGRDHVQRIERLQRLVLEDVVLPYGEVWVAELEGSIEAVAAWMDSRTPIPSTAWSDMAEEQRRLAGDRHEQARIAEHAVSRLRPSAPHRYLATVGTSTGTRRRGIGGAVLAPVLAAADENVIAAYLETSASENLDFYRTLGFEVMDEIRIEGGPPVWAMLREPLSRPGRPPRSV
jgi:predicted GNAT family N-acyltransferase